MAKIINTNNGTDFSSVYPVIVVNTSGDYSPLSGGGGGGGTGDVSGPGSSTDNAVVRWNGTGGTDIKDSPVTLTDAGVLVGVTQLSNPTVEVNAGGADVFTFTNLTLDMPVSGVLQFPLELTVQGIGQMVIQNSSNLVYNGGGAVIVGGGSVGIVPMFSGAKQVGDSTQPFGQAWFNQYGTTRFSQATEGATSATVNWNNGSLQNINFANGVSGFVDVALSNPVVGGAYSLTTLNNVSGTTQVRFPSSVLWVNGASGTLTALPSARDMFTFVWDGSNYYGNFGSNFR